MVLGIIGVLVVAGIGLVIYLGERTTRRIQREHEAGREYIRTHLRVPTK